MGKPLLICLSFLLIVLFSCSNEEEVADDTPKLPEFTIKTGLQTIVSQDLKREYVLRIPSSYKNDTPKPIVFVLHGRTGTGTSAEENSRFTELGEQEGFITVYPTALKDLLQHVSTWTNGRPRTIGGKTYDDINYIKDLITFFKSNLNIDDKRIYLTGFSNGAFMSYKFAFLEGDLFAAIAPISGFSKRLNMTSVPKKGPVSLLHIHGLKDKILPPDGEGVPRRFFNTQEVIDYYIVHNKTYETPEVLIDTKDINSKIWKAEGADGKDIQYIQAKNGVHEWFTARNSGKFNVIEYIWEFFENHPKN